MKNLADENIEKPVVVKLRAEGHQVLHVSEIAPSITDIAVLRLANQENAVVLTEDKDFGDLIFHHHYASPGVILVRLPESVSSVDKAGIIVQVINQHQSELFHAFTVIMTNKIRLINFARRNNRPIDEN
jgi:predicted nuclease of predicted toxin-antitoxin system